ncbi:porin [Pontibacter sp. SGAir0037]|uniref:porin n=1 Tax=Pontibacter sp. SGAir0037 TaxID=2571030 RepID=UPI0010CCBF98|nr:porin [Pontibacter sp. SGAir0037]QCR23670.1 porin [Pontibacter sp. SGAir0037]
MTKTTVKAVLATGLSLWFSFAHQVKAQEQTDSTSITVAAPSATQQVPPVASPTKKWYERISLRSYTQIRYNRLLETNPLLKCDQCDRSLGENGGFFIRRARLIFSGNVHERVFVYIQPDLASSPGGGSLNFLQLRDAYFDLALDKDKEFRLRFGQSKVPYGFENMQSSSNRIVLDRNDALNSAVANERDIGIFFYWAPTVVRERFEELTNSVLKGSGDYGMFGLGIYNGQTANRPEANNTQHIVARFTYPIKLPNGQFIEPGIQAYTGIYTLTADQLTTGVTINPNNEATAPTSEPLAPNFKDQRIAATVVVYPQPLGFQAEYNVGRGPEYDIATNSIQTKSLKGGYAQAIYQLKIGEQFLLPFLKMQYYEGGKKHELDATSHRVYETEIGAEWQPFKNFELVADYSIGDRTTSNARVQNNRQSGNRLRLQAQFSF